MKSGAGDDPFAESDAESGDEGAGESGDEHAHESPGQRADAADQPAATAAEPSSTDAAPVSGDDGATASATALPYKYRRSSVKEDRTQQPMFLQDDTEDLIADTVARVEQQFDEDVYKTDVVEAMIVAGGEETTPEAVLQRWGYGMKNR